MTERIAIGKIVSAHGIKGEVRVVPWTDSLERFNLLNRVYLAKDGAVRTAHIISARSHKNVVVMSLREVTSANEAEALRNWTVEIEHKDLLPLPEGHYYIFQLIGLKVRILDGRDLGVLTEVLQTGANDVYVVQRPGCKDVLIPALKSVVKKIDIQGQEILVDPLPGLLDDE